MILPIQTVILPGRSEKNSTNAKKTAENSSSASGSNPFSRAAVARVRRFCL